MLINYKHTFYFLISNLINQCCYLILLETKYHIHYFIIRLSQLVKQIKIKVAVFPTETKKFGNVHRKETHLCVSRYVTLRWSFNPNLSHYILTTLQNILTLIFAKMFDDTHLAVSNEVHNCYI